MVVDRRVESMISNSCVSCLMHLFYIVFLMTKLVNIIIIHFQNVPPHLTMKAETHLIRRNCKSKISIKMGLLRDFSGDILAIRSLESTISNEQAFLMGFAKGLLRDEIDINELGSFFGEVNLFKAEYTLKSNSELFLEYKIYQGSLNEAKIILSDLESNSKSKISKKALSRSDRKIYRKVDKYISFINLSFQIIPNSIDCAICLEPVSDYETSYIKCNHIFHSECIYKYLEVEIESRKSPILCPIEYCREEIDIPVTKDLIGIYLYDYYQNYTFENFVQSNSKEFICCPTAGCKFVFLDENLEEFECPNCLNRYCLKCRCIYHEKYSCKDFSKINYDQNDIKFIKFVKGANFKQCPKCKYWVEKSDGCNHMTCRCRFEFCYICGGTYNKCNCD